MFCLALLVQPLQEVTGGRILPQVRMSWSHSVIPWSREAQTWGEVMLQESTGPRELDVQCKGWALGAQTCYIMHFAKDTPKACIRYGTADNHESSPQSSRQVWCCPSQVPCMCPMLFPTEKYLNSKYPFLGWVLHNKILTCWINLKLQTVLLRLCPNTAADLKQGRKTSLPLH